MTVLHLMLCRTCSGARDLAAERGAVEQSLEEAGLLAKVQVGMHDCFGACSEPVAIGLQGAGLASYVFSGLDPVSDAGDIAATCQAILAAERGWIGDARPCGRLRDCLHARLPALTEGAP